MPHSTSNSLNVQKISELLWIWEVSMIQSMPSEMTPAAKTYEALIRNLKEQSAIVANAVEHAHGYRFESGILYLGYPERLTNVFARILMDSEHKPILDQAAAEMSIEVRLE